MFFVDFLRQIRKKILHHEPLIAVEISRENLLHNLNEFKKIYPKLEFAPVLKSNAYGHGIVEMAKILDQENSPFFCVDSFFEARQLRHEGIKTKILIIGYVRPEEIRSSRLKNAAFTIVDLEQLKEIGNIPSCPRRGGPMRHRTGVVGEEKDTPIGEINNHPLPLLEKEGSLFRKKIKIHLKIDTGMHRQGILLSEIEETIKIIKNSKNMILEGICSHLADADNSDEKFTLEQIENWNRAAKIFRQNFGGIKYFHLSASAGVNFAGKIDANVARLGIGLYGIKTQNSNSKTQNYGVPPLGGTKIVNLTPDPQPDFAMTKSLRAGLLGKERGAENKLDLKPALEMKTIITGVKEIEPGEVIGYGKTFMTKEKMKIATVPAGYFEGIDRRLSNCGFMMVKNQLCSIIGRVSMNITTIDVSAVPGVKIGDEVILISQNPADKNSVERIAEFCQTIPYEILVKIPAHLKRVVF